MAYYSGQASSYQELLNVLVAACVEQGWTWTDGILSKGTAFVKPYVSTQITSTQGLGLIIQGGTGKNGTNLIDPSFDQPRIGAIGAATNKSTEVAFPCNYEIFIFDNPNEVYLIVNFNIDNFYYLGFGVSVYTLNNSTGLWLTASVSRFYQQSTVDAYQGWTIFDNGGGDASFNFSAGPFWRTQYLPDNVGADAIHTGLNGMGWQKATSKTQTNSVGAFNAVTSALPMISLLPSKWSSESVLLPIQIINFTTSNKSQIVAELKNSRYLRIDTLEPKQIIQLGSEKWKVFPFYKKNTIARNGGSSITHTGTFGWAIRYDGP